MLSQASMMPARRDHRSSLQLSLFCRPFAKELCDVEVHEIRVAKNDGLNGALYLVAFMTMRGNNMQDFAGNLMFVCERDAAERMTHLLSELSLNYFAWRILVVLERLANIGEKRAGDEMIALNGNATAKRTLQDIRDRDALPRTGIEMLDKLHIDIASHQCELHRAQLIESPALSPATRTDRFVPHSGHLLAQ